MRNYPDNHDGAAQDRAMGTGTGPGYVPSAADEARLNKMLTEQAAAAQARMDARAKHNGGWTNTTIRGATARLTITRTGSVGTFLQVTHDGETKPETVLIPPDLIAGAADALRKMGGV